MSRNRFGEAVYRLLLLGLPPRFRERHAEGMVGWFREHTRREATGGGRLRFWRLILVDLARTMAVEWWSTCAVSARARKERGGEMDHLLQDLRSAVRSFKRRPGFLLLVLGTLGLGVGATTTVYSIVQGVLLAPLPYPDPDRLVRVGKISDGRAGILSVSAPDLEDLQARNRSFSSLSASRPANMTLSGQGEPELVRAAMVSSQFFRTLETQPALGRAWTPEADAPGAEPMVVLAHGFWQRYWGGSSDILGKTVVLNGTTLTVIGIMPEGFVPPEALGQRATQAWLPLSFLDPEARGSRRDGFLQVIGRLNAGVSFQAAEEELAALAAEISYDHPGPGDRMFGLSPLREETVGDAGKSMLPLLAAVGLLLAIACINVANLLLMRGVERSRELALRSCLGASRARLVRQMLLESLLLGIGGGVVGGLVALAGVKGFLAFGPQGLPRLAEITVGVRVLAYAGLISVGTSVLFGLLPALRSSGNRLTQGLSGRARGHSSSRGEVRIREFLVVVESALSIVVVICGGLLFNSMLRLSSVDPGFDPEGAAVVSVIYPDTGSPEEAPRFFEELIDRIGRIPGVRAAGGTVNLPLSGNDQMTRIKSSGLTLSTEEVEKGGVPVNYQQVTPGYFAGMGMTVLRGRGFTRADGETAPNVAVVNQTLARRLAPDGNALGRRLTLSDDPEGERPIEVVGIVADVHQQRLDAAGEPELFLSFFQHPVRRLEIVARGGGSGEELLPAMRRQVWALRPDLPVRRSVSLSNVVSASVADRRFLAVLMGCFAVFALTLTAVGVYGTLGFSVQQRRREFGVRLSLGATGPSLMREVLMHSMKAVSLGLFIGIAASFLATGLLETLLFGVTTTDPLTMGLALIVVLGAAAGASIVPAARAAILDPAISLRLE